MGSRTWHLLFLSKKNISRGAFVTTNRPFEKAALDLMDLRKSGVHVIVAIDVFTRFFVAKAIPDNKTVTVKEMVREIVEEWWPNGYIPEYMIKDNGREFQNDEFKKFPRTLGIEHRSVDVEAHRSNGRVERVISTIREGILKT